MCYQGSTAAAAAAGFFSQFLLTLVNKSVGNVVSIFVGQCNKNDG